MLFYLVLGWVVLWQSELQFSMFIRSWCISNVIWWGSKLSVWLPVSSGLLQCWPGSKAAAYGPPPRSSFSGHWPNWLPMVQESTTIHRAAEGFRSLPAYQSWISGQLGWSSLLECLISCRRRLTGAHPTSQSWISGQQGCPGPCGEAQPNYHVTKPILCRRTEPLETHSLAILQSREEIQYLEAESWTPHLKHFYC